MAAKSDFIQRITYLHKSFSIQALNDLGPIDTEHNGIARLLRNGMAVVGFLALEDFIKNLPKKD